MKFYFTYGSEGQPFFGGWTEIEAPDVYTACDIFRSFHPDEIEGLLNCSSFYGEEEFKNTSMAEKGNFNRFCHEKITVNRELITIRKESCHD